jgi:hypothetical protein
VSGGLTDLVVYLRTGLPARRLVAALQSPGMTMRGGDAGIEGASISEGALADQAGLEVGDLLLRVGGVPVFAITHGSGRLAAQRSSSAVMTSIAQSRWAAMRRRGSA